MANYEINLSDGSKPIIIPENTVDCDTTSIALIGHGKPSYGKEQNENFLHILENFSSKTEPNMPIKGQIWFKQSDDGRSYELRICSQAATKVINEETNETDAKWDKLLTTTAGSSDKPINPSNGDIWYDYANHQFNVYDTGLDNGTGAQSKDDYWNIIGPVDAIHESHKYFTEISDDSKTSVDILLPGSFFNRDLYTPDKFNPESSYEPLNTGSLHMVTLKVLIKEVKKSTTTYYDINNLRHAALIYRFVVKTISSEESGKTNKTYSILGAPNYEILAKSDDLNFDMNTTISGSDIRFTINNSSTTALTYFVNGVNMEITRV